MSNHASDNKNVKFRDLFNWMARLKATFVRKTDVDSSLSTSSTNPVQNRTVTQELKRIEMIASAAL